MLSLAVPPAVRDPLRLAALDGYAVLDTPAETGFDDIVQLACLLASTPVALVSLVAEDRQWFKARVGFPPCETNLNSSVCAHALATPDDLLIIPDLTDDPRTAANPLVTSEPFIRFYAGAPLVTPEGLVLGSLCVIDSVPRPEGLTHAQGEGLKALARQVMIQLELRRAVVSRDSLRAEETRAFRAREAQLGMQTAVARAGDNLDAVLTAVVQGVMQAVPQAEGGAVELVDGDSLEYRAVAGTLAPHAGMRVPRASSLAGHCADTRQPQLLADATNNPYLNQAAVARVGLRSAVMAPIVRGDTLLGVLKLQSGQRDAFTRRDMEQVSLFAGAATAGLSTAEARDATRANDHYWRGLFDRLNEGFLIGEAVRDPAGRIHDWRYVEVNPAWGRLVGVDATTVVGRTIREVFPGIEEEWITDFAQVVETGQPTVFTRRVGTLRRWYEGRTFKLDGNRFGVIFLEITGRVEAETRRVAMLALVDQLRDMTDPDAMTMAACAVLGKSLDVMLVGYGDVDPVQETITVARDWTTGGAASLAGTLNFRDFGSYIDDLKRDETVIVRDCRTDPRTREYAAALEARSARAFVNMPVTERGAFVALLYVSTAEPRDWTPDELAFIHDVATRLRSSVSRVRAENQQDVLNRELAHRLKNTLAVVQSVASQTLRGVTERHLVEDFDRRVLALSRAHEVLLQKSWASARMQAVMQGVLGMQADLNRFTLTGPDLEIGSQAALSLSMLLHELTTNALKYGALSVPDGRVAVTWCTEGDTPALVLEWREQGGPPATAPTGRGGFGSKLIRMGLVGTRAAALHYDPTGFWAEFRAPLSAILQR